MPTSTSSTAFNISTAINLRADRYYIAEARGTCGHCRQATRLVAVVLPGGHEVLEWDDDAAEGAGDDAPDDAGEAGTWEAVARPAFLFHVAYLPEHVQRRLCAGSAYSPARSAPGDESCWVNHCEHCGAPFDDQELFCEPGGAFCPASDAEARSIDLSMVEEPIGVDAAGYAEQPQFFESMNGLDAMNRA
jgi:hypothetical protein